MVKVTAKLQGDKCPCEIDMRGNPAQIIVETAYIPSDGSGQGRGPMTAPPCLACPDRRIGCHDPAVCPRWAAYDEIHRAKLAAMPSRKEWVDMVEYIHDRRRRYMPGRWKKGDKSC